MGPECLLFPGRGAGDDNPPGADEGPPLQGGDGGHSGQDVLWVASLKCDYICHLLLPDSSN